MPNALQYPMYKLEHALTFEWYLIDSDSSNIIISNTIVVTNVSIINISDTNVSNTINASNANNIFNTNV